MISSEQMELRRKYIGSSDAAAVCGCDPYRSASDVFMEKTGRAAGFEGNENTERGTLLEPVILNWAEREIGLAVRRDVPSIIHASGLLVAHLDGDIKDSDGTPHQIVEAKSSVLAEEWGEPGTNQIPQRVLIQVHHQFAVAGPHYRLAWVPVLLPGFRSFDFRMYRVERDDELAEIVAAKGVEFMERYVLPGVEPEDFKPSLEVLKRVRREPNKTIKLPDRVVTRWLETKAACADADKLKKEAEAMLLAALADAECGTYAGGQVSYMETKRRGYVVEDCVYRQLRHAKAKAAKETV